MTLGALCRRSRPCFVPLPLKWNMTFVNFVVAQAGLEYDLRELCRRSARNGL